MKRVLSLIIVGALIAPALPVAAEETVVRSVDGMRVAPRIDVVRPPAGLPSRRQIKNDETVRLDWSRVRKLKPGREVRLMAPDATSITRYFVSADERALTVVNVDQSALPRKAVKAILELLSRNPDAFLHTDGGELHMNDEHVRVAPEGLFVGLRKVADRDEFVQTIARADVQQSIAISRVTHNGLSREAKIAIAFGVTIGSLLILARMTPMG
jgi:hypothetical protein